MHSLFHTSDYIFILVYFRVYIRLFHRSHYVFIPDHFRVYIYMSFICLITSSFYFILERTSVSVMRLIMFFLYFILECT